MPAIDSRYSRSAVRTRTVTGTTSVGGTTSTVVSIQPDGTIRFVDRQGRTVDVPIKGFSDGNMVTKDFQSDPFYAFVDALIARA